MLAKAKQDGKALKSLKVTEAYKRDMGIVARNVKSLLDNGITAENTPAASFVEHYHNTFGSKMPFGRRELLYAIKNTDLPEVYTTQPHVTSGSTSTRQLERYTTSPSKLVTA